MIQNKKSAIFNFLYRKAHHGNAFWRCLYGSYTQFVLGCDIKPSTKIGTGFKIFHSAHASVVSPGTIIGNNVSLRQNTTIGAKGFNGAEKSPIIKDNVTIGPNACIIGYITIGEGAVIGAGSVVVKDVPPHAVVVGNPAKVIKFTKEDCLLNKHKSTGGGENKTILFPSQVKCSLREENMDKRTLKNLLRENPPLKWILTYQKRYKDQKLAHLRAPYIPLLEKMLDRDTCIISSNCFAGRIMQDLGMQYNTPTLGLYFMYPDYIEFLRHLEYYLKEAKIEFVEHSKYALGDERRAKWKHWYPIGWLDGKVEIHFLHYHTEEEAATKWHRRASRVNFNKLLVIGMEQNLCKPEDIYAFDALPFKNKFIFTSKDIHTKSNVFMPEFTKAGEVGDPYRKGHIFYRYLTKRLSSETDI